MTDKEYWKRKANRMLNALIKKKVEHSKVSKKEARRSALEWLSGQSGKGIQINKLTEKELTKICGIMIPFCRNQILNDC